MLKTGLTSITFRPLSVDEIIALTKECGIDGIEWGGDVHAKPGELALAKEIKAKTKAAGLAIPSYGSYYRCNAESGTFEDTLATAQALGAPVIRVWAGEKGSADAFMEERAEVVISLQKAVDAAKAVGVTVALEYHGGTLTDTQESAHQLLAEVGRPELKLYWQPRTGGTFEGDIPELKAALPHMAHVHCFHWGPAGWKDRHPLADGVEPWTEYLKIIREADGDRYIIFEFVKGDQPDQLRDDAKTLHALINS
ncbi:sugar phosphate isomerase/epimerase family protein [Cerasicoccus arenae]|uniref:Sugar phosphate isomerase n=1 Tax=Cerasicoccus arenae TaxID=424488 RepID=A0A8J3GCZ9_9BACT|nr:sugar phosphate isomerase/epimerase family protein [Cerasicoccus arenae]MBK1857068.1 sugar phosphate isomerase/epimerase [Cerasicoccus arenae]GHB92178.1 sugar phosphate isomerase [Cerasicoccus arenae]